jgi:hypothetical protein
MEHRKMTRAENVTIRLSKITKVALDIYQAKQYGKTAEYMTNDQTILALLELVDPDAVRTAREAAADATKRTGKSSKGNQ